jgi:hypothetical protein
MAEMSSVIHNNILTHLLACVDLTAETYVRRENVTAETYLRRENVTAEN